MITWFIRPLGRRRVMTADPRSERLRGQRVCIEVSLDVDNVWGGWCWLPDEPSELSIQRAEP